MDATLADKVFGYDMTASDSYPFHCYSFKRDLKKERVTITKEEVGEIKKNLVTGNLEWEVIGRSIINEDIDEYIRDGFLFATDGWWYGKRTYYTNSFR